MEEKKNGAKWEVNGSDGHTSVVPQFCRKWGSYLLTRCSLHLHQGPFALWWRGWKCEEVSKDGDGSVKGMGFVLLPPEPTAKTA